MKAVLCLLFLISTSIYAQKSDLFCNNNPARAWWDVLQYDLQIDFGKLNGEINGKCKITARVISQAADEMQIDLDKPMKMVDVIFQGQRAHVRRQGRSYFVKGTFSALKIGDTITLDLSFSGQPSNAKLPPWNGGFIHKQDSLGNKWMAVACQSEGGSIWFPCKNYQGDEAEEVLETYIVPYGMMAVGNGKLMHTGMGAQQQTRSSIYTWKVSNPINTYNITFYIGNYSHWRDTIKGLKGDLTVDYYALKHHEALAKRQFMEVRSSLNCFEEKFGPYPFYEDGYKIVEAPFLGMEHQSAIAYGNHYMMGYEGYDISESGSGLLFDYIIVHETAHEWFGNSVTACDQADNWLHEGFASYAETIYLECMFDKKEAENYQAGKRRLIRNKQPVQGNAGQCDKGSSDQYYKSAQMIHMLRKIMQNDSAFFELLREINRTFYHQLVSSRQVEQLIMRNTGLKLETFFEQYLRNKDIPVLELRNNGSGQLEYRYTDCIPGFRMPMDIAINDAEQRIDPTEAWQTLESSVDAQLVRGSRDFLVRLKWPKQE